MFIRCLLPNMSIHWFKAVRWQVLCGHCFYIDIYYCEPFLFLLNYSGFQLAVSIACVLLCCLCVKSALFVMFGIVFMDLTRNLSLCDLCVAVKQAKLKQIHLCFLTSETERITKQNLLWYMDLAYLLLYRRQSSKLTVWSKLNSSCALCLHHCTLCYGNRLSSHDFHFE